MFEVRAQIDPAQCIGCVRCIKACPVDAIMGAPKRLHQVIESYCTGCEDCVTACPVDCITLVPVAYLPAELVIREAISKIRTEAVSEKIKHKQSKKIAPEINQVIAEDLTHILARAHAKRQALKEQRDKPL